MTGEHETVDYVIGTDTPWKCRWVGCAPPMWGSYFAATDQEWNEDFTERIIRAWEQRKAPLMLPPGGTS